MERLRQSVGLVLAKTETLSRDNQRAETDAQKAMGTSFLAILVIALSAVAAHGRLANVDYRLGILLGIAGIIGAQIGPRLLEHVSTANFKKVLGLILVGLAVYLFTQK